MTGPRPIGPLAHDQAGFTVVEAVIAAMILAIGALGVLGLVDAASHNTFRAEQSQVVNDRLQQEMEAIKQLPYDQVALTGAPAHANDPTSPNSRVAGTTFDVNRSGGGDYEDLVYNGATNEEVGGTVSGGQVSPGGPSDQSAHFTSGNVSGTVYRYVTWETDQSCGNCADRMYKHVVVAVALDPTAVGGTRSYQEIQGNIANPNAGLSNCPQGVSGCTNPGGPGETPWTFWLTDTPCSSSIRLAITASHLTHNTLDRCATGMQTGTTPGAPDLMFTQAAPCVNGCDTQQDLLDYATDVEAGCTTTDCNAQDKGLQEVTPPDPTGLGCTVDPTSVTSLSLLGSAPQTYIHKWVSPQIPAGSTTVVLDGSGTLDVWTKTVDGAPYPGRICVWLFVRNAGIDTLALNLGQAGNPSYFTYSSQSQPSQPGYPNWPSGSWTEIHLPLHFAASVSNGQPLKLQLPEGARLGLAIAVERQGTTPGSGLQFMYDSPSFDSRLEVDTKSLLPIFN